MKATPSTMKLAALCSLLLIPASAFAPATNGKVRSEVTILQASRRDIIQSALVGGVGFLSLAANAAAPRPMYLTEPTEEFKANEAKAMEFKRQQLVIKAEFVKVLNRLTTESKTEEQLVTDLTELRGLVIKTGGLPLGIQKEDMYKMIRRKKAEGNWPTDVEYMYQKLKAEIAYQQSPNTEKDDSNPL